MVRKNVFWIVPIILLSGCVVMSPNIKDGEYSVSWCQTLLPDFIADDCEKWLSNTYDGNLDNDTSE